jgi:hypothetical protein
MKKNHVPKTKDRPGSRLFVLRLPFQTYVQSHSLINFTTMVADTTNYILAYDHYSMLSFLWNPSFDYFTPTASWSDDEEMSAFSEKATQISDIQFYLQNQLHLQHLLYLNTLQQCLSCDSYPLCTISSHSFALYAFLLTCIRLASYNSLQCYFSRFVHIS